MPKINVEVGLIQACKHLGGEFEKYKHGESDTASCFFDNGEIALSGDDVRAYLTDGTPGRGKSGDLVFAGHLDKAKNVELFKEEIKGKGGGITYPGVYFDDGYKYLKINAEDSKIIEVALLAGKARSGGWIKKDTIEIPDIMFDV